MKIHQIKLTQNDSNKIKVVYDDSNRFNKFNMKRIHIFYNLAFCREMIQKIKIQALVISKLYSETRKECVKIGEKDNYLKRKQQICKTFQLLGDLRKKFIYDDNFRKQISTATAIVEFNSQQDRDVFIKLYGCQKLGLIKRLQQTIKGCLCPRQHIMFRGQTLTIVRAPDPSDLLYLNCQQRISYLRIFGIYLAVFFIIIVSFAIILILSIIQQQIQKDSSDYFDWLITVLNFGITIALIIVNKGLWLAIQYFNQWEYNPTITQKIVSQMNKAIFATCINIIVLPLLLNAVYKKNLYGQKGLVGIVFDYQISLLSPLAMKLISPADLVMKWIPFSIRKIRNWRIRSICADIKNLQPEKPVDQINQIYQGIKFNISENYTNLMSAIYHAIFFCSLHPFLLFLVTGIIFLSYCVNKFMILRMCKLPEMTQFLVFETFLSYTSLVPVFYGVGCIVINYFEDEQKQLEGFVLIPCYLCIFIGSVDFFNPKDFLNKTAKCLVQFYRSSVNTIKQKTKIKSSKLDDRIKKDGQINRQQSYYKQSNSLSLFAFQYYLQNIQKDYNVDKQLQHFCEEFFPQNIAANQKKKNTNKFIISTQNEQDEQSTIKAFKVDDDMSQNKDLIRQKQQNHFFKTSTQNQFETSQTKLMTNNKIDEIIDQSKIQQENVNKRKKKHNKNKDKSRQTQQTQIQKLQ